MYVPEFYDNAGITKYLEDHGIHQTLEGLHGRFSRILRR